MSAIPDFTADDLKMRTDTWPDCLLIALQMPANHTLERNQVKDLAS
jgi:hypothetical protein